MELLRTGFRGEMIVKLLEEMLDDPNFPVQMLAIEILGGMGNRPSLDAILAKTADRRSSNDPQNIG